MKATKLFFGEKRLKDIYVGATKWEIIKYRVLRTIKRVLIVLFVMSAFGWTSYGAYIAGMTFNPEVVYAEKTVEVPVREFPPILEKICLAESGGKQFGANGRVLRGRVNPSDIGYCQINEYIWNDKARELGYDIFTENGNRAMALWIFDHQGSDPWSSSRSSWSK